MEPVWIALLYNHDGFAPHGIAAIVRKIPAALFSVSGAPRASVLFVAACGYVLTLFAIQSYHSVFYLY
jgi:hypothetical protein